MKTVHWLLVLFCGACDRPAAPAASPEPALLSAAGSSAAGSPAAGSRAAGSPAAGSSAAGSSAAPTPAESLAALDPRTPVPLLPPMAWHQKQNMMDHLLAIQQITAGLASEDWTAVEAAAARMGSSPTMAMQCDHMGAGAEGFTERALDFHARADGILEAAQARDTAATLAATGRTLAACTECHATYRQDVVDAATWTARTSQEHAPGHP